MIIYEHEFRKYWQIKPTLTVWKLIESINTFVTLVARNVWITVTFSRFIITCIIYWSKRITSTVWKDKNKLTTVLKLVSYCNNVWKLDLASWRYRRWSVKKYFCSKVLFVYLPSIQLGKSKYPDLHSLQSLPMILGLQKHNPEPSHVSVPSP